MSAAQVDTRIKAVVTASLVDISGNSATLSAEERQAALDSLADVYKRQAQTQETFDLLLGDNLSGRKEHIIEYGHNYIDMIDVS